MNRDQFEGKWTQLKGKLRSQWAKLTDDDVGNIEGKFERLSGKLQERYGHSKEDADREVENWLNRM